METKLSHEQLVAAAEDINAACVLDMEIPLKDDSVILKELKECDGQLTLDDGLNAQTLLTLQAVGSKVLPGVKTRTNKRAEKILTPKTGNPVGKLAAEVSKGKCKRPTPLPSAGGNGEPGIIDTIKAMLLKAGKAGLNKTEMIAILKQAFPTRPEKGMRTTLNVNVPTRLNKRTKLNIIRKGDRFVATGTL